MKEEEIDLTEGVDTFHGMITMNHAMIDVDGTNLEDGLEIRVDGKVVGEALGFTSSKIESFESVEEIEEFIEKHTDL